MRHPSEGVLRRLVDEPAGVPDADRAHVAGCPACLRALDTARTEARLVRAPLTTPPAVAALSAVLLMTGAGVAAANDWLPIFQTERVDPVEVTSTELVQLPDLSAYGDLEVTQEPGTEQVADAAAAQERTGLAVPEVAKLPEGVTGDPAYQAAGTVGATFYFLAETSAQAAAAEGGALPPLPAGLDGSSLRLEAGPGV